MAFRVNVRVNIDPSRIEGNAERAQEILASHIKKDTEKDFLPWLNGVMARGTKVYPDKIVYPPPYAHYLWEGIVYVDPMTGAVGFQLSDGSWISRPGITKTPSNRSLVFTKSTARSHWIEPAKEQYMERWKEVYRRALINGQ